MEQIYEFVFELLKRGAHTYTLHRGRSSVCIGSRVVSGLPRPSLPSRCDRATPGLSLASQERRIAKMAPRLTYRRRHSYHTKSNAVRIVKTPGVLRASY